MSKTIFITGASRGFGKLWAEALKRSDKVAATARNTADLAHLVATYGNSILPVKQYPEVFVNQVNHFLNY